MLIIRPLLLSQCHFLARYLLGCLLSLFVELLLHTSSVQQIIQGIYWSYLHPWELDRMGRLTLEMLTNKDVLSECFKPGFI